MSAVSPLRTETASFQMPRSTSRRLKATFGCRRKSLPSAEGCATVLPECASHRSALYQGGKCTRSALRAHVDGMHSSHFLVIPRGIPAMNFRQRDKGSCFGRHHPCTACPAAASRSHRDFRHRPDCGCGDAASIAARLAREHVLIATRICHFSRPRSLRKEGMAILAPVVFTDQWARDSELGLNHEIQIAVLDDYQNAALESADWSVLSVEPISRYFKITWTIQMP